MNNVKIHLTVLLQERNEAIVALNMTNSELYMVEGDAGKLLKFVHARQKETSLKEIKEFLSANSASFKKNPEKEETILQAIKYFKKIDLLDYAD